VANFSSLYFTDCRAGEGLLGGAGLQFRAVSAGTDPRIMDLVQRHCLYEPPEQWMHQGRPTEKYPRSLTHIFDGHYITASGVYLGAEAKGTREGNHFTHALVTNEVDSYGEVRPAQLWGSAVWVGRADGGTVCDPVPAEPEPGPLQPDWLQRWVAVQPDGEAQLTAVISALEGVRADGPRVIFIAEDPGMVLTWLAAATILLPRAEALRIGFKVFVVNAEYSTHDVIALHPDLAGSYRGASTDSGFVIFDLDAGVRSSVTPTATARHWVPRFLRQDCFDVLDAVELSGALRSSDPHHDGVERTIAGVLILGESLRPADIDSIIDWLASSNGSLSDRLLAQLFALILDGSLDSNQLEALGRAATQIGDTPLAERIRWQVFARDLSDASGRVVPAPSEVLVATAAVEQVLADAEPETLVRVLSLASRYTVRPAPARFLSALQGFAHWWAEGALELPEVDRWSCRAEAVDLLRDELSERVRGAPAPSVRSVGELWWRRLWQTIQDPRSLLDATLAAAAVEVGGDHVRRSVTRAVLSALRDAGAADGADVAWRVLYSRRSPTVEEVLPVLACATPAYGIAASTGHGVAAVLAARDRLDASMSQVLARLSELGYQVDRAPLIEWQREVVRLRSVTERLRRWGPCKTVLNQVAVDATAAEIGEVSVGVVEAEARVLIDAMRRLHPEVSSELVRATPVAQCSSLLYRLGQELAAGADERTVAMCFLVVNRLAKDQASDELRHRRVELRHRLVEYRQRLSHVSNHLVANLLAEDERPLWWKLADQRSSWRPRNPFRKQSR